MDATDLLGLADTEEGDLVLTEEGKQVFREHALAHVSILRYIVHALEDAPRHVLPEEHFQ